MKTNTVCSSSIFRNIRDYGYILFFLFICYALNFIIINLCSIRKNDVSRFIARSIWNPLCIKISMFYKSFFTMIAINVTPSIILNRGISINTLFTFRIKIPALKNKAFSSWVSFYSFKGKSSFRSISNYIFFWNSS